MASTYNKIIVVGHLTRDPVRRSTPQGMTVTTLSVATNHRYATADGTHEEVCFLDVTVFGRQADATYTYLHKGSKVLIDGRLRQQHWETDGQKRSKHDVVAERVNFMDAPTPEAGGAAEGEEIAEDVEDEIPF